MDLAKGKFGYNLIRICAIRVDGIQRKHLSSFSKNTPKLLLKPTNDPRRIYTRNYGMFILRAARGLLKIRYLVLGGAISGGVTLQNKYELWRDSLPDMTWIKNAMPDDTHWQSFRTSLTAIQEDFKNIEIRPHFSQLRNWFDKRLNDAITAVEEEEKSIAQQVQKVPEVHAKHVANSAVNSSTKDATIQLDLERIKNELRELKAKHQNEIAELNSKYQHEVHKLNKENLQLQLRYERELDKLNHDIVQLKKSRKEYVGPLKRSLVEMYSDVLDKLSEFESTNKSMISHQLPQVVVVGSQSSGKTSVLEMIANARIFPRGSGRMMTRAPVQVTLSTGPNHVAQFRDSSHEYDLNKETDLSELRSELENRMLNSVRGGKTVSNEVISMSVRGPGLHRMVLVDLPGTIVSETVGMEKNTRSNIENMARKYMSNPNAIILCIQDGSVDAENSSVTSLASQIDPEGKRTIFVLTKADRAEKNYQRPDIICEILSGKKFIMKALGYFVVVTGRDDDNDSISEIQKYEEEFFMNSKLFKNETVSKTVSSLQMTTRNLSRAVAECFWKMVRENIEQQRVAFKNRRTELEAEWKDMFPKVQKLDRNELFAVGRNEILDLVSKMTQIPPRDWDECLNKQLLDSLMPYVFDQVYVPALQEHQYYFNMNVDKRIRDWSKTELPKKSVGIGLTVLQQKLVKALLDDPKSSEQDIFTKLKTLVLEEVHFRHKWEQDAVDLLGKIQAKSLENKTISTEIEWKLAADFLIECLINEIGNVERHLKEFLGPSFRERWFNWKYTNKKQTVNGYIKNELANFIQNISDHPVVMNEQNINLIRTNLKRSGIEVNPETILEIWVPIYKKFLLQQALIRAYDGKKLFSSLNSDSSKDQIKYNDIKLFWRINQMIKQTVTDLRQQIIIINGEAHRVETEIRNILNEISQNDQKKRNLFSGKRIELSEELICIRRIEEKLDDFIKTLNSEN